jgi:hypothetical protein
MATSFSDWMDTCSPEGLSPEERERFFSALDALERNWALETLLNWLEADSLRKLVMTLPSAEDKVAEAHRELHAVRRLRVGILSAFQNKKLTNTKL